MSTFESIPAQVVQLQVLLGAALTRVRQLEQENAQLRERLGQNSTHSSKPPSSDAPGTDRAKKRKKRKRRHPGGQPGHPKHERERVPLESVQQVVELVPQRCQQCQRRLKGRDAEPQRHQVVELEPVTVVVTEYRRHRLECAACGSLTRAEVPREARSAFGERLAASMSLLVGKYRLSKRRVEEVLSDLGGVHVSVGSVSNLEQEMSAALKAPVEQAQEYVRNARVVHADEMGWAQGVKAGRAARAWLWVVASALVVVFRIATRRGSQVIQALLGKDFPCGALPRQEGAWRPSVALQDDPFVTDGVARARVHDLRLVAAPLGLPGCEMDERHPVTPHQPDLERLQPGAFDGGRRFFRPLRELDSSSNLGRRDWSFGAPMNTPAQGGHQDDEADLLHLACPLAQRLTSPHELLTPPLSRCRQGGAPRQSV